MAASLTWSGINVRYTLHGRLFWIQPACLLLTQSDRIVLQLISGGAMRIRYAFLSFVILVSSALGPVAAQEADPHALDGTELEYTYTDGGSVVLNFYDGLIKYHWIAGPNEGMAGEGFEYSAKFIGDDRYMVVWRSAESRFFVTMVINLEQRTMFTSALSGYETEQEVVLFDKATIHRVVR